MDDVRATRVRPSEIQTVEIAQGSRAEGWLVEIQDEEEVRRIPLKSSPMIVGSGRGAEIVVRDPTVSAKHCEIAVAHGAIAVRDLGSRNGTYVGGARIQEASGSEGTTITIGQTTLVCMTSSEEDADLVGEPLSGVAGASAVMCRVATQVRRLAKRSAPVLVSGETGVGKELIARALHEEGPRHANAFVALNVAALPRELVESELFGHERGAFTGAIATRVGAFTEAAGGTLFLDEIGDLPIDAQPKLLRALDGYEVRSVGAQGIGRRASARVVAATHVKLLDRVTQGSFRRDLFHRLEVFVVELPPLRARPGDILPIARALLARMIDEVGRRELSPAAIATLTAYEWPGNVRELKSVLLRAADYASERRYIDTAAIERALRRERAEATAASLTLTPELAKDWLMNHGGNISAAARAAGLPRTSFRKLLRREPDGASKP